MAGQILNPKVYSDIRNKTLEVTTSKTVKMLFGLDHYLKNAWPV